MCFHKYLGSYIHHYGIIGKSFTIQKIYSAAAAAAVKSPQSCPTLCDPIDGSASGSPVPGILQARTLEWVAISFSNAGKWKVKVKLLSLFLHIRYIYTFTYTLRIYFFTYTLCITYLLLLLVQIPDSHLLTISVDLSCPEYHTSGIIQSLAFFDLFPSLSSINLRFIFEWMNSLFPFNAGWYSILQMYHYLFIHS